jgi:hypothetical protein
MQIENFGIANLAIRSLVKLEIDPQSPIFYPALLIDAEGRLPLFMWKR